MTSTLERAPSSNFNTEPTNSAATHDMGGTALKAVNNGTTALLQPEGISGQELTASMNKVESVMLKMQDDPSFIAACTEKGIDPFDDVATPGYWDSFSEFALDRVGKMREKGASGVMIDVLELAATTPSFTYHQTFLDSLNPQIEKSGIKSLSPEDKAAYEVSRKQASLFNGRVRAFADTWNPVATDLHASLSKTILMSTERPGRDNASNRLASSIRGAQHEKGFKQIVDAAGLPNREATPDEDLKGVDRVVNEPGYQPLNLDIKASLSKIEARGGQNVPFVRDKSGNFKIYSLIKDNEFVEGRFHISEDAANTKAAVLPSIIAAMRATP